ncbi:hypothetical protein [Methanosarcina thermophila]|nr:hypothetical protein [Methanosarcina thermophila]
MLELNSMIPRIRLLVVVLTHLYFFRDTIRESGTPERALLVYKMFAI